jgi:hypothetical protein
VGLFAGFLFTPFSSSDSFSFMSNVLLEPFPRGDRVRMRLYYFCVQVWTKFPLLNLDPAIAARIIVLLVKEAQSMILPGWTVHLSECH